jgi:succinylglutamate desuccinylase
VTPELGRLRGGSAGPTLIVVGGIHGNEPAGVGAFRRVLARLDPAALSGEVIGFRGNPAALVAGRRYLARDLNRQWTPALIASARAAAPPDPEAAALVALADALERVLERARGPVFALDLHTTSAEGIPFAIAGAHGGDRTFAAAFPLPVIVGLQESLGGTLTEYLAARGCVPIAVEGGQNESPSAAANLEAAILIGLAAAGITRPPGLDAARDLLARARGDLPQQIEVALRHPVGPGFRMVPGFANIQRAVAGTLLAHDAAGEIRAPFDGLVLMPLYQAQGTDGFFFARAAPA